MQSLTVLKLIMCMQSVFIISRRFSGEPASVKLPEPPEPSILSETLVPQCNELNDSQGINLMRTGYDLIDFRITHNLFLSNVITYGLTYKVTIQLQNKPEESRIEFSISSLLKYENEDIAFGYFSAFDRNSTRENCSNSFQDTFSSTDFELFNWFASGRTFAIPNNDTLPLVFRIRLKEGNRTDLFQSNYNFTLQNECNLELKDIMASEMTSMNLPPTPCKISFPNLKTNYGLIIELKRFNVPCKYNRAKENGFIKFDNYPELCGKFEQLSSSQKVIYYPHNENQTTVSMTTKGQPVFTLRFTLVDFCYNMTFRNQSGLIQLHVSDAMDLSCSFRFFMPYGFKVNLTLSSDESIDVCKQKRLNIVFWDGSRTVDGCNNHSHLKLENSLTYFSKANKAILWIEINQSLESNSHPDNKTITIAYNTTPETDIVKNCKFAWVSNGDMCIRVFDAEPLNWFDAESWCQKDGGHLVTIHNEKTQYLIDDILFNNPESEDLRSYWIGASDRFQESYFRWPNGVEVLYKNWFLGWPQFNNFNKQPNDDGFSEQDCVEIRKSYHVPMGHIKFTKSYVWNDRNCFTPNHFICEQQMSNDSIGKQLRTNCDRSIFLSRFQAKSLLTSPEFPRKYPDHIQCYFNISAPDEYRVILEFDEFDLENELNCSYDYLEVIESNGQIVKTVCGDWSSKLKLLRYISNSSSLNMRFTSDYSNNYNGYKIRISIANFTQCPDDRFKMFNKSCYLFVSYPTVTWKTASQTCKGIQADLASIQSPEEQKFIINNIRRIPDNKINSIYWLGAYKNSSSDFQWIDNSPMSFNNFHSSFRPSNEIFNKCLSLEWIPLPNGFYWNEMNCYLTAGYVCKKEEIIQLSNMNNHQLELNDVIENKTRGFLYSPNYPDNYFNNVDSTVTIRSAKNSRIAVQFQFIDIEQQSDCLYDYIAVKSNGKTKKMCGSYNRNESDFNFISDSNQVVLRFHSDYSISKKGFLAEWKTIDTSTCPQQTITATDEGNISSINYPDYMIRNLNCSTTILAPQGKRIWLQFIDYDSYNEFIRIDLGDQDSFVVPNDRTVKFLSFLSHSDRLQIIQKLEANPVGKGFLATYKLLNLNHSEIHKVVQLSLNDDVTLRPLNYPSTRKVQNVDYIQHLIAPVSYNIIVKFVNIKFGLESCSENGDRIEIIDNYASENRTKWYLCDTNEMTFNDGAISSTSLTIKSHFHTLFYRQKFSTNGFQSNALLQLKFDDKFKSKLVDNLDRLVVESCEPNPCFNQGKCAQNQTEFICQCPPHFTGLFCYLSVCDLKPCVFGKCALTETNTIGFDCTCDKDFTGRFCDIKKKPCDDNPCENRGLCIVKGTGYFCQCHAWWEGVKCEKRIAYIPYKSLTERMFQEPFWLGLIAVFVVMMVIGLVWCARKHFPEKLEKLLAEEADRNRSSNYTLRSTILNDTRLSQFPGQCNGNSTGSGSYLKRDSPNNRKSLLSRFGLRKLSLLSLTSNKRSSSRNCRTFSLDDLLTPLTISINEKQSSIPQQPQLKKERGSSKRRILKQLLKPVEPRNRSESLIDLNTLKKNQKNQKNDEKDDKKVTFAKLLSKVSTEISSESNEDADLNTIRPKKRKKSLSFNTLQSPMQPISSSSSSYSSSSEQVASFSLNEFFKKTVRNPIRRRTKTTSADSLLTEICKRKEKDSRNRHDSSTPNDVFENNSLSSGNITPISFSSTYSESSQNLKNFGNIIEVTVIDPSNSTSSNNYLYPPSILLETSTGNSKYHLSPIREMPTPLASPMTRSGRNSRSASLDDIRFGDEISDDKISIEFPTFSVSYSDGENEFHGDITIAELPSEENSADQTLLRQQSPPIGNNTAVTKNQIPASTTKKIIVPTLIVQEPSPTQRTPPTTMFCEPPTIRIIQNSPSIEIPPILNEQNPQRKDSTASTSSQNGMCLLSPFQKPDRINSESNLSSSGYSSMASPGPSRCNSNNPLCDNDETSLFLGIKTINFNKKPSPLLKSPMIVEQEQEPEPEPELNSGSDDNNIGDVVVKHSNDSSLSESPISESTDNALIARYTNNYTDSDCTYDHSSSDYQKNSISVLINKFDKISASQQHRKTVRRKAPSPTRKYLVSHKSPKITSPKRKLKLTVSSSSSSSDSLSSATQASKCIPH